MLTSYDGIIHIRLKGRSLMTSSQPADTSSPVLYEVGLIIQRPGRLRKGEKKILYRPVELEFF